MIYLLHITQRFVSKLKSNVQKSSYMLQYAKKTVCFASCFFRKDETSLMISFSCCNHYPLFIVLPQVFSTGFNSKFDDFILMLQHTTPLTL